MADRAGSVVRVVAAVLADPGFAPADDCGIVLRYLPEVPVRLVPGSERSITVTGPADIEIAEAMMVPG